MASASSPPLKHSASFSLPIRSSFARSCLFAIRGSNIGKCLLIAGPKLSEAFTRLSIAAKYRSFDLDLRQRYSKAVFCLIIIATIVLSSTISFGSKSTLNSSTQTRSVVCLPFNQSSYLLLLSQTAFNHALLTYRQSVVILDSACPSLCFIEITCWHSRWAHTCWRLGCRCSCLIQLSRVGRVIGQGWRSLAHSGRCCSHRCRSPLPIISIGLWTYNKLFALRLAFLFFFFGNFVHEAFRWGYGH